MYVNLIHGLLSQKWDSYSAAALWRRAALRPISICPWQLSFSQRLVDLFSDRAAEAFVCDERRCAHPFAEGAALAAKADNAGAAALLADAEHKKRAAAPQKKRYDFDF